MEELKKLIHKGCITNKLVPVFCGSAFKNKGVQPLLDGVVRSLLSMHRPASAALQPLKFRQTRVAVVPVGPAAAGASAGA